MILRELPYQIDSTELFAKIADLPWAMFLDSGRPFRLEGRFDILTACPYITLITRGLVTEIKTKNNNQFSDANPFDLLKKHLNFSYENNEELPFTGGAMGYFAYDLARHLERLPIIAKQDIPLPEMAVGIYDWAIIIDHHLKRTLLVEQQRDTQTNRIVNKILERLKSKTINNQPFQVITNFTSNFTKETYAKAFARIQTYLHQGDCYQINLAQRFQATVTGSSWELYQTLRQNNPAAFGAYFNIHEGTILSLSPERFLKVSAGEVETKPIKGTKPRGLTKAQDQQYADELLNSEKDRAENLMIVDLMRNDISKNCRLGSVKVSKLFALESFPAVHHLVSTITGHLKENKTCIDLLRDCFPGGSITGAPKIRAMEIIEELEPHRRSVYCGSIGYIDYRGNMDTNIAIRTLIRVNDQLYCYAGGGITVDSEVMQEYEETLVKVAVIMKVLKT